MTLIPASLRLSDPSEQKLNKYYRTLSNHSNSDLFYILQSLKHFRIFSHLIFFPSVCHHVRVNTEYYSNCSSAPNPETHQRKGTTTVVETWNHQKLTSDLCKNTPGKMWVLKEQCTRWFGDIPWINLGLPMLLWGIWLSLE